MIQHLISIFLLSSVCAAATVDIPLDQAAPGPEFGGIGALSAGASSRLLPDYPEPQRSQILDLLFAPQVGASLQHLKVEIGGEVNSTCGSEPSHRRTREETPDFTRGYEWWLMREARARRPGIPLDTLAWGAPAWIGGGRYYSQDMADYVADFIAGARREHGLDIAFTGIWNERQYDIPWIKTLRRTLDARGLGAVQIVAADACTKQWAIANDMALDPALAQAIAVIGEHYPGCRSSATAAALGKPLWAAEDGPWNGTWNGARQLARVYNRNFVQGGMTRTVIWSLISSYYDNLPLPGSGLMRANTPWSGAYEIQPALWATAHTTQFAQPGWRYCPTACRMLPDGGSVVALRSADGGEASLIVETMDATAPVTLRIALPAELRGRTWHPWLTSASASFVAQGDLTAVDGVLTLTVPPDAVCSLTTTTGQGRAQPASPAAAPFPSPYRDDFETTPVGRLLRYGSDQGGVFEVAAEDGGHVLRQQVVRKGIEWQPTPDPETFLGDPAWEDQRIRVRARLAPATAAPEQAAARYLAAFVRVGYLPQKNVPAPGYALRVADNGQWEVRCDGETLARGTVPPIGEGWHDLDLAAHGERITAALDGHTLATVEDRRHPWGQPGIGCGYHAALFDDLQIEGATPLDLARGATASASSVWDRDHGPERAVDGIAADGLKGPTRWNSGRQPQAEEWLEVAFATPTRCDTVRAVPFEARIDRWRIEVLDGTAWRTVARGEGLGALPLTTRFPEVSTTRLRLVAEQPREAVSLYDLQVFRRTEGAP